MEFLIIFCKRKTGKGGDDKEKNEKEGGRGGRRKNEEETGPKPSGRVVLFQFLEDKIPFPGSILIFCFFAFFPKLYIIYTRT